MRIYYPINAAVPETDRFLRLVASHTGPGLMDVLCPSAEAAPAAASELAELLSASFRAAGITDQSPVEWNRLSREERLSLLEFIFCHVSPSSDQDETIDAWLLADVYDGIASRVSSAQIVAAMLLSGYLPAWHKDGLPGYAVQVEELPSIPAAHFFEPRRYRLSDTFRASVEGQQLLQRWEALADFNFPE